MDLIEIEVVDMALALTLTLGITEFIKRAAKAVIGPAAYETVKRLAPLYALVAASVAVAVLIDVTTADMQVYLLAVIVVTLSAVGIFSGTKNVGQAVQRMAHRP